MTNERAFSDVDLHAYLDGELSPEERGEVEAWLARNPDARVRLQQHAADRALLREALEPVVHAPLPPAMDTALEEGLARPARRNWGRVAAGVAIFAFGALAGWTTSQQLQPRFAPGPPSIAQQAIDAHLVYLPEVRHPVEVGAEERDHLVAWLSRRLGHPLEAPDLTEAGFQLMGGRLLPASGAAAAQFMYEDAQGERLTLLVAINPDGRQTAFRLMVRDGARSFYWFDGPFGYAVTGVIEEETLLRIARAVYAQLEGSRNQG